MQWKTLSVTIMAMQQDLDTSDLSSHLLEVQQGKLQKFQLQESQVDLGAAISSLSHLLIFDLKYNN